MHVKSIDRYDEPATFAERVFVHTEYTAIGVVAALMALVGLALGAFVAIAVLVAVIFD